MDQTIEFRHRAALALIAGGSVLDLGCGDGLLLTLLKDRIDKSVGLDISPEAIRKATTRGCDARVHSFDEPLPFEAGAFDTVVLLDVLEHLYDPMLVLKEAARVARQRIIVGVPNFSSLPARLQMLLGKVPENNRPNKGHLYWFNHTVLREIAGAAGLELATLYTNTFRPFSLLGEWPTRLLPNLLALSFVAELRAKSGQYPIERLP